MDENSMWTVFWKLLAVVLCVLIVSVSVTISIRQYQIRMLIENAKVNPIDAICAMGVDSRHSGMCAIRATK